MLIMRYPIGDQACSTWALSGDESSATNVHQRFMNLANDILPPLDKQGKDLKACREEVMKLICSLRDPTEYKVEEIYFCGYFISEHDHTPAHFWIEDHTNKITTDTYVDRNSIVAVSRVGIDGEAFQPGCEPIAIQPKDIVRVRIDGYTKGQIDILTRYNRPPSVVAQVLQSKRDEIASYTRALNAPGGAAYILEHLVDYPHRNNAHGIRALTKDAAKLRHKIGIRKDELRMLEENPPIQPGLPELENGDLVENIIPAMQDALEIRRKMRRHTPQMEENPRLETAGAAELIESIPAQASTVGIEPLLSDLNLTLAEFSEETTLHNLGAAASAFHSINNKS